MVDFNFLPRLPRVVTAVALSAGVVSVPFVGSTAVIEGSLALGSAERSLLFARRPRRPRPPRRLPPNRVQPGGGLDEAVQACDRASSPLTALVPVSNPVYTASAHPTFLFHLPDSPEVVDYAEFILLSADEKEQIYSTRFSFARAGIVHLSVPSDAAYALEPGQAYHWYLNLHCETTDSVPSVNGWIQRVEDASPIATASPTQPSVPSPTQLSLEDAQGESLPERWYDAIAETAALLSTNASTSTLPSNADAQADWQSWLSAAGLAHLIDVPIVGAVTKQPGNESSTEAVELGRAESVGLQPVAD
ncbi:MAG: DUF928 domain-containing protein [Cyanobacteria bacterium J06614_10]